MFLIDIQYIKMKRAIQSHAEYFCFCCLFIYLYHKLSLKYIEVCKKHVAKVRGNADND